MSSVCDMYKENPKEYKVYVIRKKKKKKRKKVLAKKMLMYM